MPTARKYTANNVVMSRQSRNSAYAAINILWLQMRPDLKFESKEILRGERLGWIAAFLRLPTLESLTDLSDGQIGLVLDEMKLMTGTKSAPVAAASSGNVVSIQQFDVLYLNRNGYRWRF